MQHLRKLKDGILALEDGRRESNAVLGRKGRKDDEGSRRQGKVQGKYTPGTAFHRFRTAAGYGGRLGL